MVRCTPPPDNFCVHRGMRDYFGWVGYCIQFVYLLFHLFIQSFFSPRCKQETGHGNYNLSNQDMNPMLIHTSLFFTHVCANECFSYWYITTVALTKISLALARHAYKQTHCATDRSLAPQESEDFAPRFSQAGWLYLLPYNLCEHPLTELASNEPQPAPCFTIAYLTTTKLVRRDQLQERNTIPELIY